jgi:hypothetical protein
MLVIKVTDIRILRNEGFKEGHEELVRIGCSLFFVYVKVWTWHGGWQCC